MGWTWEVEAYVAHFGGFRFDQAYTGESLKDAIRAMREAKKTSGCVRLTWR